MNRWCAPRIYKRCAQSELLHNGTQGVHTVRDLLWLVRECLEKPALVLLSVQPDNECLRSEWCYPSNGAGSQVARPKPSWRTHLSACSTSSPVMSSQGTSSTSKSLTRIRDVTLTTPPRRYRSLLQSLVRNCGVDHTPLLTSHHDSAHV